MVSKRARQVMGTFVAIVVGGGLSAWAECTEAIVVVVEDIVVVEVRATGTVVVEAANIIDEVASSFSSVVVALVFVEVGAVNATVVVAKLDVLVVVTGTNKEVLVTVTSVVLVLAIGTVLVVDKGKTIFVDVVTSTLGTVEEASVMIGGPVCGSVDETALPHPSQIPGVPWSLTPASKFSVVFAFAQAEGSCPLVFTSTRTMLVGGFVVPAFGALPLPAWSTRLPSSSLRRRASASLLIATSVLTTAG